MPWGEKVAEHESMHSAGCRSTRKLNRVRPNIKHMGVSGRYRLSPFLMPQSVRESERGQRP